MTLKTARSVLLKGVSDVLSRIGSLVTFPILAAYAGTKGYGDWGQVHTLTWFVVPFASLGLGTAMVRFFSGKEWTDDTRARFGRVLSYVLISTGAAALAFWAAAPYLNRWFLDTPGGTALFRWGAFLILLGAAEQVLFDFVRSRQWLSQYSVLQIAQSVVLVALVAVMMPAGLGLLALLKAMLIAKAALVGLVLASLWSWNRPRTEAPRVEHEPIGRMVRFGIPLAVAGLGAWLMNLGDRLVIGNMMSASQLGVYGAIFMLATVVISVNAPLNLPLYPRLMRSASARDAESLSQDVRLFHRYATLALVPSGVFLSVMASPILVVLGGNGFRIDDLLGPLVILPVVLSQWNSTAHYLLMAFDEVVFSQNIWLAVGALNVAANLVAVPVWGLHGAAAVTLATFLVLEVGVFRRASRYAPLKRLYRMDVLIRAGAASAVAGVVARYTFGQAGGALSGLVVASATFAALYVSILWLFGGIMRSDLAHLGAVVGWGAGRP